jgi:hypothetical protein
MLRKHPGLAGKPDGISSMGVPPMSIYGRLARVYRAKMAL